MVTRSYTVDTEDFSAGKGPDTQPKQISIAILLEVLVFACALILISSAIIAARLGTAAPIAEPLHDYLPGSLLPELPQEAQCHHIHHPYISCRADHFGQVVYVSYKPDTRIIASLSIRVNQYRLGDLMVSWGTPSGIIRYASRISIHWGRRSAILHTHSLRPDSRVESIAYHFEERPVLPWPGFMGRKP